MGGGGWRWGGGRWWDGTDVSGRGWVVIGVGVPSPRTFPSPPHRTTHIYICGVR